MKSRSTPLLALVLGGALFGSSSAPASPRERPRQYHVLHYALNLTIDQPGRQVSGTVTMRVCPLEPITTLEIDAEQMTISSVQGFGAGMAGAALPYTVTPAKLVVTLPRMLTVTDTAAIEVAYSATPATGLFFVRPDTGYPDLPVQVWSQGEMEQNHYWFPCYDYPNDKATVEMRVTVSDRLLTVSNGAFLSVTRDSANHTATYSWYCAKPISSYLISIIAGDYVQVPDHYKTIPLYYNVYPSQREDALRSFRDTPSMIAFYSERTGFDFPWPKYSQTVVSGFTYGGMENVSATTLTDRTIHDARADLDTKSTNLVAHELAHQWFGDLLTCRTWAHAWLNEGFATYFEALYNESSLGWDDFQHEIAADQNAVLAADVGPDRRPTVSYSYTDPEDVFDAHIYARGACILNMMRFVLGDHLFWDGIKHYVDMNQYQCVTTDDFRHAMEDVAKRDLGWFFDEWTLHAGYPEFQATTTYDSVAGILHLDVDQGQQVDSLTPLFRMPVSIEIATDSGVQTQTVWIDAARHQRIDLAIRTRPLNIVFDKGGWILKHCRMSKPLAMWLYQVRHGDAGDRVVALDSLASSIQLPEVFSIVSITLRSDAFWGVRQKAAEVLGKSSDGLHALAPAFSDLDARVRATATASLVHFKSLDALVALGDLFAHDSSYAVQAAALEALVSIDPAHSMGYCERGLSMSSHNDVIRAAAIKAMGAMHTAEAKSRIVALTRYGQTIDVRLAALDALVVNWPADNDVERRAQDFVNDRLFAARRRAIEHLGNLGGQSARTLLEQVAYNEANPLLRREARKSLLRLGRVTRLHTD